MSLIISIETTSKTCSVALSENSKLIDLIESTSDSYTHAENLSVYIDQLLKNNETSYYDLSAIALSEGPGSYTGLRIGAATSKGLCYVLNIPLIAINTLEIIASEMKNRIAGCHFYCPMIDARRMEVYTAVFDESLNCIEKATAKILDDSSFIDYMHKGKILFGGSGAEKFIDAIENDNAKFLNDFELSACYLIKFAHKKLNEESFEDIAYFEPFYLKNFQATIPKDKLKVN